VTSNTIIGVPSAEVCTTKDLAEHFGVDVQIVRAAARRGSIPGGSKILSQWVFDKKVAIAGWSPVVREEGTVTGPGGAFQKGNAFGVGGRGGRPKREFELKFLRTLVDTVSPEDWCAIIQKAVAQAKDGNHRARSWLSNYLIGTPLQRIAASVDVTARRELAVGERAAGVMALLQAVREREEAQVVEGALSEARENAVI